MDSYFEILMLLLTARFLFTLQNGWLLPLMLPFRRILDSCEGWKTEYCCAYLDSISFFISYIYSNSKEYNFIPQIYTVLKINPSDKLHSSWGEGFCQNQAEKYLFAVALSFWEVPFLDATKRQIFHLWFCLYESFLGFSNQEDLFNLQLLQNLVLRTSRSVWFIKLVWTQGKFITWMESYWLKQNEKLYVKWLFFFFF